MEFKLGLVTSQLNFFSEHSIHTDEHIKLNESSQSEHIRQVWPTSGTRRPPASHGGPFQYWVPQSPARTPPPWLLKPLCHRACIYSALDNTKWLFKVLMPIYTPTSTEEELCASISSPTCRDFLPFSFQPFQWARGGITLVFTSSPW